MIEMLFTLDRGSFERAFGEWCTLADRPFLYPALPWAHEGREIALGLIERLWCENA